MISFLGCNPWQEIYDREMLWYNADKFEQAFNLELVSLKQGGFLEHNPRIIIRENNIEFDNRAWFLSLPDEFFLSESDDVGIEMGKKDPYQKSYLIERHILDLQDGLIPQAEVKNLYVGKIHEVLQEHYENNERLSKSRWYKKSQHFTGTITFVVEPNIPIETVRKVMYTAGSSMYSNWTFAGKVDNQIRALVSSPTQIGEGDDITPYRESQGESCLPQCTLYVDDNIGVMSCGGEKIILNETCPPSREGLLKEAEEIQKWCQKNSNRYPEENSVPERYQVQRDCLQILNGVTNKTPFYKYVEGLQLGLNSYPRIKQYYSPVLFTSFDHCPKGSRFFDLSIAERDKVCQFPRDVR